MSPSFTHTWIFGTQAGMLSFYEPMITLEYLLKIKDGEIDKLTESNGGRVETTEKGTKVLKYINGPEAGPVAGYYPKSYKMEYDKTSKTFKVALMDFEWLEESNGVLSGGPLCPEQPPPPV